MRRTTQQRQIELTDAALEIIGSEGIRALTARSLADRVGLTSGAVFRHYPTMNHLLDAVVVRVEEVLEATFPDPALPPLDQLDAFITARTRTVGAQFGIFRLVVSEQFRLALQPDSAARLQSCVVRTRTFIRDCLDRGREAGLVRTDIPLDALSAIVIGTVQMLVRAAAGGTAVPVDPEVVRRALLTLLKPVSPPVSQEST